MAMTCAIAYSTKTLDGIVSSEDAGAPSQDIINDSPIEEEVFLPSRIVDAINHQTLGCALIDSTSP